MESERTNTNMNNNNDTVRSNFFVAVHVGAGYHSPLRSSNYMKAMKEACLAASKVLEKNGSALDAVVAAISSLEDSPITNAGKGSNLTEDGRVECDASIMEGLKGAEGNNGAFGAVGAVRGVKNPIQLAATLLKEEHKGRLPLGRIRPIFLVGEGAREYARARDLAVVSEELMITEDSRKIWREHKRKVDGISEAPMKKRERLENSNENSRELKTLRSETSDSENSSSSDFEYEIFDTVGAICYDMNGHVSAGVSSGGVSLKHTGRVSEAAHYGSGCWAFEDRNKKLCSSACSTSGAGEQIMKSMLAYETVKNLVAKGDTDEAMKFSLENQFLEKGSPFSVENRYGGLIALKIDPSKREVLEFTYGHTTESMGIGYLTSDDVTPKVFISRMATSKAMQAGKMANIGGVPLRFQKEKL